MDFDDHDVFVDLNASVDDDVGVETQCKRVIEDKEMPRSAIEYQELMPLLAYIAS